VKKLFARKSLHMLMEEMGGEHRLRRVLGPVSLTSLGIGTVIGAGIFVVTGEVARNVAGPAVILSYVVAGIACIFAALCYAEFAAMAPVAGSAYTYAYATLGEIFAWIIGWDLVIEYTVASAAVATGWSKYFQEFLRTAFHTQLPKDLSGAPYSYDIPRDALGHATGKIAATGNWVDLPALLITVALTVILVIGIRESARFNATMVMIKVAIVFFVIGVGVFFLNPANWHPFAPHGFLGIKLGGHVFGQQTTDGKPLGVLAGAAMVFFAYIGFDSVSTHSEEARNPQRDIPIGIIVSLLVCTVLYIAVSAVLTGMVPYEQINIGAPVSAAFDRAGLRWAHLIISIGAIAGITSVILVLMLSQPRVLLAMARDGLLPVSFFGAVHPRFRTPWKSTILTGVLVGLLAAFLPLSILFELVNIGTLLAFVIVCLAVLIMRRLHPEAPRPFRCPWVPVVPVLGALICLTLMFSLPWENWLRLFVWLIIGMVIYFSYGRHHSVMAQERARQAAAAASAAENE
jgi:APA family basic amino acid/polyamine antiporter